MASSHPDRLNSSAACTTTSPSPSACKIPASMAYLHPKKENSPLLPLGKSCHLLFTGGRKKVSRGHTLSGTARMIETAPRMTPPLVLVGGPTASGKSALALA